jgi:serine protease Do
MMLLARGRAWPRLVLALTGLAVLAAGIAPAEDKTKSAKSVLDKPAPEGVADLKALQAATKAVLKKSLPATVGLIIGQNAGSGVIVNAEGYVLTAGHVSGEPGRDAAIILPDGTLLKGKTLGRNDGIDSGMIKITSKLPKGGKWPFAEMGDSSKVKKNQWVVAVGHPGGPRKGRTPVVRLGRVLATDKTDYVQTDCPLVGGDSGGPLFNMDGKVIGIHSRINEGIAVNVHVPIDTYRDTWKRLAAGESWGGWLDVLAFLKSKPIETLGFEMNHELKVDRVAKGSNAEKAGLKKGDQIIRVDGTRVFDRRKVATLLVRKKPGEEVTLLVRRGDEDIKLSFKLAKKSSG